MSDSKGLLILAAIGFGAAALLILSGVFGESGLDISGYFDELVETCQADHPDWDRAICVGVIRQEVWVGMNGEMLIASLGEPDRIEKPREDHPEYEEWIYMTTQYGDERMMLLDGLGVDWGQVDCDSCALTPRPK